MSPIVLQEPHVVVLPDGRTLDVPAGTKLEDERWWKWVGVKYEPYEPEAFPPSPKA